MFRLLTAVFLLALLCACAKPEIDVTIPFVATWQGREIGCAGDEIALSDLRLYVSNVELLDRDGVAHPVRLRPDLPGQDAQVALLDFETGDGACINGTSATRTTIDGSAPRGDYQALRFTVGVPFDLNHANPLTAASPLDDAAMHWHWRSGYKFLRAGVVTPTDGFWIHLGSAGCEGSVRNITGCRFPNRVEVRLPNFTPSESVVGIELHQLLEGTDLEDGVPTDCSSGPAETACVAPFRALGIDFESGAVAGKQQLFSLR
jgi:uncharacterized repeat protein (TIGR04052 family)